MTDNQITGINKAAEELEERIRQYCRSQKEIWRRVPYLALQADGKAMYDVGDLGLAYKHGLWALESSTEVGGYYYNALIDLATGEIVSDPESPLGRLFLSEKVYTAGDLCPAKREYILALTGNLEELDAAPIVKRLERLAKSSYSSCHTAEEQQEIMRERGIEQLYTRTREGGA